MAKSCSSVEADTPDHIRSTDYRFSGFSYQNWDLEGEPPITVNPKATMHHKLAWLWGEIAMLNDAIAEWGGSENKELLRFSNFVASRLMAVEAMLDHLGSTTSKRGGA